MARITQEDPWAKIPHWVLTHPDLDASAVRVYLVLSKHANKARECFPGTRRIADEAHVSRSTVQRSLLALEVLGAVEIDRGRIDGKRWRVNQYHLPLVAPSSVHPLVPPLDHPGPIVDTPPGPTAVPELDPFLTRSNELEDLLRIQEENPIQEGESKGAYAERIRELYP